VELWEYIDWEKDEQTGEISPSLDEITESVLRRVAEVLDRTGLITNVKRLGDELIYRESQAPTVIGNGVAIPHVRSKNTRDLAMCFLRYPDGVPMLGAQNVEIVSFFFGIVTPIFESDTDYQKVYRKLLEIIMKDDLFLEKLTEINEPGEIVRILKLRS